MTPVRHPTRSTSVRKANERHLLKLMHARGIVTQADLAGLTGLQASTIFRIFKSLEEREIIQLVETDLPDQPRQGRRPGHYRLNPTAAYSLGVDFAHGGCAVLLADYTGNAVLEREIDFAPDASAESVLSRILQTMSHVLASQAAAEERLLGVGIGAPGVIDIEKGTVVKYSRLPGMEGLPLKERISEALGVPVLIHNNASVIALAENRYGRAAGHRSVVAFLVRTGVGGAFVQDGELYTSQGMTAFEVGHMTLNVHAQDPAAKGETLEDLLAEGSLIKRAASANPRVRDLPSLVQCMGSDDAAACGALEEVAEAFIEKARNIALMLNPEAFVIIARHLEIAQFFAKRLSAELSPDASERYNLSTVIPLEYDPILACRGAADLVFDSYFAGQLD